ncbi:MAG TPA: hypothetical protein VG015_07370 [Candidatus Dormibacteraeota bacterium]|nr:hypothetical protein [Candidatus Dormibacteraeota bacterium]
MTAVGRIPVDFYFDEQVLTWHFHTQEPRIVGGGQATLEDARRAAAEAIAFALEGLPPAHPEGQIEYLDVAVG